MFLRIFFPILLAIICQLTSAQIPNSGLSIWLRADKDVVTKGSYVITWKDQGKEQHDAFSTSEAFPQLIKDELNGYPVIRFNGKNNGMQTKPFLTFPNKRGTIIIIARINDSSYTSGGGYSTFLSTYFAKGVTWQMGATPYILYFYDGVGGSGFPYATITPKDWLMVTLVRRKDNEFEFRRIGKHRTSFEVNNNQPDTNAVNIGFNGRLEVLNGDIAEVIMYSRVLSEEEFTTVHGYLSNKYNIYWPGPPFYETWWFYTLVSLLGLLLIVGLTKYISQRNLKKKLAELERQSAIDKERLRISREMHDDIGAGLTRIAMLSEMAKHSSGKKEFGDIANASRQLVNNMSEIIWSLNPEHKTLDQLFAYLREELNKLLEPSGIDYSIELPGNADQYFLSNEQKRNILLVTKEIVHNAVKYSNAQNITIKTTIENDLLSFVIRDNGKGFEVEKNTTGNGLRNIQHRLKELKAEYSIASEIGAGVISTYHIPLKSHSNT